MRLQFQDHELSLDYDLNTNGSNGADCLARHGGTVVLCKVIIGKWMGFDTKLPLTVSYNERAYAINRIPGGFSKRESKSKESEILSAKFIGQSLRFTIDESFRYAIHVNCTVMGYAKGCSPEALAVTAASSTLALAGVPCNLVCGVSLARVGSKWLASIGPSNNLIVSGNYYGISACQLDAQQLTTDQVIDGLRLAANQLGPIIDFVRYKLKKFKPLSHFQPVIETNNRCLDTKSIVQAYFQGERNKIDSYKENFVSTWQDKELGKTRWEQIIRSILSAHIIWNSARIDGRDLESIRHMTTSKDILPSHSCSIVKGKTKLFCISTMSSNQNEYQLYESLEQNENRKFVVHCNYLFDVKNNDGFLRSEIEDANLIRNTFKYFMSMDRFIRLVIEVIQSDGSNCVTGVYPAYVALQGDSPDLPLVCGISIGGFLQGSNYKLCTDLTSLEEFLADFELRISGTKNGVIVLHIDSRVQYIPWHIAEHACEYAFRVLTKSISQLNERRAEPKEHKIDDSKVDNARVDHQNAYKENTKNTEQAFKNEIQKKDHSKVEKKQDKNHSRNEKDSTKNLISINLNAEQISRLMASGSLYENESNISGNTLKAHASIVDKLLTIAFDSRKELCYSKIIKILDNSIEIKIISNGSKCHIKLDQDTKGLHEGDHIIITKGKSNRWSFIARLDKMEY